MFSGSLTCVPFLAECPVRADAEVAVHGGAAGPDYLPNVNGCEALGLQVLGALYVGLVSGHLPTASLPTVFHCGGHACPCPLGQLVTLVAGGARGIPIDNTEQR